MDEERKESEERREGGRLMSKVERMSVARLKEGGGVKHVTVSEVR